MKVLLPSYEALIDNNTFNIQKGDSRWYLYSCLCSDSLEKWYLIIKISKVPSVFCGDLVSPTWDRFGWSERQDTWICGEILPYFDMHHVSVGQKLSQETEIDKKKCYGKVFPA